MSYRGSTNSWLPLRPPGALLTSGPGRVRIGFSQLPQLTFGSRVPRGRTKSRCSVFVCLLVCSFVCLFLLVCWLAGWIVCFSDSCFPCIYYIMCQKTGSGPQNASSPSKSACERVPLKHTHDAPPRSKEKATTFSYTSFCFGNMGGTITTCFSSPLLG